MKEVGEWIKKNKDKEEEILKMIEKCSLDELKGLSVGGVTILEHFVVEEKVDIVKILVEKGLDVNQNVLNGDNLLYYTAASLGGGTEILQYLIEKGIHMNILSDPKNGFTPLMWSGYFSNWEQAKILIENGADPYLVSKEENPFIMHVIRFGSKEWVSYFLKQKDVFLEEEIKQLKARRLELLCK